MSLLDDEDEPFVEPVLRSSTREPLYDGRSESPTGDDNLQHLKAKEKKDKKKLDERRSSAKALPWSKSSAEKTPKKGKHHRTKSGSPPPVSPKGRGQDLKRQGKGTLSQVHPSPNVKSQRKRYIQLGVEAGSSSEGEVDLEEDGGFLLSNQPALSEHQDLLGSTSQAKPSAVPASPKATSEISFFDQETSEAQADAWWPQPSQSKSPKMAFDLGASVGGVSVGPRDISEAFLPHSGRTTIQASVNPHATTNPLLGELSAFSPPQVSVLGQTSVPPLLPAVCNVTAPSQPLPVHPPQEHAREPDWNISKDLRRKCVQQFNNLKPTEGLLQGDKAREFFVQSKLPNQELSTIWRLSDTDRDNALSEVEFCIAMKLVLMRRKGFDIPSVLPDPLQPKQERCVTEKPKPDSHTTSSDDHHELTSDLPSFSVEDQILVDIGGEDSDTGLLVEVNDDQSPAVSPPPAEPSVAKIISIDNSWDVDEDREDTALVGMSPQKSDEDAMSSPSRQKPARPAPPKPSLRRPKTIKEKPELPSRLSEGGSSSPPAGQPSDAQSLIIIDSRQKSKVSGSVRSPGSSRRDYSLLGEDSCSQDHDDQTEEKPASVHVRWKNGVKDNQCEDSVREGEKGHARSTSLDLNKMLLVGNNSDVLEDVPSAEPPKPPPKPLHRASTNSDQDDSTHTKAEKIVPRGRARALSTGSIDNPTHDETMDTSTDALLLMVPDSKPHPLPKPRRKAPVVPSKPQRPPPPSKPAGLGRSEAEPLHTKDKVEVQAHIRSLKENNSALTEINGHLEDKLFKLIEERVRLAKQLKELQLLQQQQNHQQ